MINNRLLALCVAAAALAGCNRNNEPEIVGEVPDPQAAEIANAAPVELPPMIQASHSYRCKDNSTVFVDWFNDGKTANLRASREGEPTRLAAPEAGQPFVAEGHKLAGKAGDKQISLTRPGKGEQTCHA